MQYLRESPIHIELLENKDKGLPAGGHTLTEFLKGIYSI